MVSVISANVEQYASIAPQYAISTGNVVAVEINPNNKGIVEDIPTGSFPPPLVTDIAVNNFVYDV